MKFQVFTSFVFIAISSVVAAAPLEERAPPPVSYFSGFNLGANRPDGRCKTQGDWEQDFRKIQSWSTNSRDKFNSVKLFSTADCDTLVYAVPAAIATNTTIWAGIWPSNQAKFDAEKAALEVQLKKYQKSGNKWLRGINVGSEALYRKEIDPNTLARYIYDVKGMTQIAYKASHVPVGCADTWTSWVDGRNKPVIDASDVILMNAFPYWQGVDIKQGLVTFQNAVRDTLKAIGTKPFVVGETGWPTGGPKCENPNTCKSYLQTYYTEVACWLQKQTYGWYWFSGFDEPQRETAIEKNFGIATSDRTPKIKFTCPK